MNRHDPSGQITIRDLPKACVEEHLFQSFLIREVPNGGRQIFIDAGRVMRHFRANPGQKPERVPIVQGPQPTEDGPGKLQAHKPPAWLKNTMNFREGLPEVADVPHAEPGGHRMEGRIGKSQMLGVGFKTGNLLAQTPPGDFLQPFDEHGMVQVRSNDTAAGSHARFNQEREIGCARADVECPAFSGHGDIGSSNFLPSVVQPKTQKRVVEIIDAGDRREHSLDRLLARLTGPGRDGARSR